MQNGRVRTTKLTEPVKNLTDCDTGSFGVHARCNVHGGELLEQQFGSVRNVDLGDLRFVPAGTAFEGILFEVPRE